MGHARCRHVEGVAAVAAVAAPWRGRLNELDNGSDFGTRHGREPARYKSSSESPKWDVPVSHLIRTRSIQEGRWDTHQGPGRASVLDALLKDTRAISEIQPRWTRPQSSFVLHTSNGLPLTLLRGPGE